ncbi:MAG: hypothetical protein ACTS41_01210 [Candidatus Hodgkinia cicadicola]
MDRRSSVNDAKVRLRRSIRRGTSSTAGINRLRFWPPKQPVVTFLWLPPLGG